MSGYDPYVYVRCTRADRFAIAKDTLRILHVIEFVQTALFIPPARVRLVACSTLRAHARSALGRSEHRGGSANRLRIYEFTNLWRRCAGRRRAPRREVRRTMIAALVDGGGDGPDERIQRAPALFI